MHYLSYLATKLAAESNNRSPLLTSGRNEPHISAESLRQVLEEEVAAGRLRYNALSCDMEAVAAQDEADPCFPEWAENQS